jgi:NAD(P)-dependent dehydrogenase (short-subunit alcohol dehydrogenase family)
MKQAVVTGAGTGLGAEIAKQLSESGYRVGVLDMNGEQAQDTAASLSNAIALQANVSDEHEVKRAFEKFGDVPDLLVNCAGVLRTGPFEEQSVDDYRFVLEINLLGSCICARQVAPGMMKRGSGHIINITSIGGIEPSPNGGTYGASKAALAMLTKNWSTEWGPKGIRVNAIAPGFIDAGMSKPFLQNPEVRARRIAGVPIRKLGTASDIAHTVLFLDSEGGSYISGTQTVVDGGVINNVLTLLPRE